MVERSTIRMAVNTRFIIVTAEFINFLFKHGPEERAASLSSRWKARALGISRNRGAELNVHKLCSMLYIRAVLKLLRVSRSHGKKEEKLEF